MKTGFNQTFLGYLWPPSSFSPTVADLCQISNTRIIIDLCSISLEDAAKLLAKIEGAMDNFDYKISPAQLFDQSFADLLGKSTNGRFWVEVHPFVGVNAPEACLKQLSKLMPRFTIYPILGDINLIMRVLDEFSQFRALALKGSEASGFVSAESTQTLYFTAKEKARMSESSPSLFIWGGIATAEAAAAFFATGSKAIVFEGLHWLTDAVNLNDGLTDRILKLQPDHTELVGLDLQVPCRLFSKGNSKAVKRLQRFSRSLCGTEVRFEQRRFFADHITGNSVQPLESSFGRDELIPLGVEAGFSSSFVQVYGCNTLLALEKFRDEINARSKEAEQKEFCFVDSPVAREMGTQYPFIQGAMTWITDAPEFAGKVADAGGLPTIALGTMSQQMIQKTLNNLQDIIGDRPYAVNVVCLAENPFLDEQLQWILKTKPCFAVIAAGDPIYARDMLSAGIQVIYIAPNAELIKLAFKEGVRMVICEGNEAGGHIGEYTALTFAQILQDLKRRDRHLFNGRRLIFAGGICNRETAFMAAMLGADAIQMGTAYLGTEEIVTTGALSKLYQRMIISTGPGGTVISGESVGLRVRSLKTEKIDAICALERDFNAGVETEVSFRKEIEALGAGSLLIAARGMDPESGDFLDEQDCLKQGQFMSGACAGSIHKVQTINKLHQDLAQGPLPDDLPVSMPFVEHDDEQYAPGKKVKTQASRAKISPVVPKRRRHERIAITGMSIVNSLGNNPLKVWKASQALKSGVVEVPSSKWNHAPFYDPRPRTPEKTYCNVAAFMYLDISRKELGIPPQDFRTMTNATKITLWLAKNALEDSNILQSDLPRERIGVFISQNSGEAAATLQDIIIRGSTGQLVSAIKHTIPLNSDTERAVAAAITSGRLAVDDTTLLGRLNCTAAGFICNAYGFQGPSFAVSAACATSLVALFSAYHMIRNGVLDAALVGGAEELLTPMHFLEFSALGALAGLSGVRRPADQVSRPFDVGRDGMVLGEGGGMIVVERESTARKRPCAVHGFITSMGASNNHLGMVESSRSTQEIAIRASFDDAEYGPDDVNLIECHATSTIQGDIEEVKALSAHYQNGSGTVLSSFKSQIGHTLGASGINSLIRALMAAKSGIFPPTLNCSTPDPQVGLQEAGFAVHTVPEKWIVRNSGYRRFQVNSFGFGGSNYVLQVEQPVESRDNVPIMQQAQQNTLIKPELDVIPPQGLFCYRINIGNQPYRMGIVAESKDDARTMIKNLVSAKIETRLSARKIRSLAGKGVYLGAEAGDAPPVAFVFPGQGAHYGGMGYELYRDYPEIRKYMDLLAQIADYDLLEVLFRHREEDLQHTRWQQPALFVLEYAMAQCLYSYGIRPAAVAGHSLGELTALCLAGVFTAEDGFRIVDKRAEYMANAGKYHKDPGIMVATNAPLEHIENQCHQYEDIYITNINSPQQIVFGGASKTCRKLSHELKKNGFRCTKLNVSMAFHSPLMACIRKDLEAFISHIEFHKPQIPVISNTTMHPYPDDPDEIRSILMAHLESPVYWMQNIKALRDRFNIRCFVEVGPRDILCNLITDTLPGVKCFPTCLPTVEVYLFKTALAQVFAAGLLPAIKDVEWISLIESKPPQQPEVNHKITDPASLSIKKTPLQNVSLIKGIIQGQINAFVLESFGQFLKPRIIDIIRDRVDGNFTEAQLDEILERSTSQKAGLVPEWPRRDDRHTDISTEDSGRSMHNGKGQSGDFMESVIQIIMEATGYDREEIEPEMNLREDLSIRSSRLPVILDAIEQQYGQIVDFQSFAEVQTIKDLAERLSEILSEKNNRPSESRAEQSPGQSLVYSDKHIESGEKTLPIKRFLLKEVPIAKNEYRPVQLDPSENVVILSQNQESFLASEAAMILRRDYGVSPIQIPFLAQKNSSARENYNLLATEDHRPFANRLKQTDGLAGMVITMDDLIPKQPLDVTNASVVCQGFLEAVKVLFKSASKKFLIVIHRRKTDDRINIMMVEALRGMQLSLAHEFPGVLLRSIELRDETPLSIALRKALDQNQPFIETIFTDNQAFTREVNVAPLKFEADAVNKFKQGDVVVFSGGGYGIMSYLARPLISIGCRTVFLGRTQIDINNSSTNLINQDSANSNKVIDTLETFKRMGAHAIYFNCDITDPDGTRRCLFEIKEKFGRIDGIIHGAGVVCDKPVHEMTADDFDRVFRVKVHGAWNLFNAAGQHGLKCFICISSAAAVFGNHGQVNYASANRAMPALMPYFQERNDSLFCKTLILPPIEGVGMADKADVKAILKRLGVPYVSTDELAALFSREMHFGSREDMSVMYMRSLPPVNTVSMKPQKAFPEREAISAGAMDFCKSDFPMIDRIQQIDLDRGKLIAEHIFSHEKDLWIADHKPFKALKHPIVSAIMVVETFMEAAKILNPHLRIKSVRNVEFLSILSCPSDMKRASQIICRAVQSYGPEIVCNLTLKAPGMTHNDHIQQNSKVHYRAELVMGIDQAVVGNLTGRFPVNPKEITTRPMKKAEILEKYQQKTDMQTRYRLMDAFDGSGEGVIRGRFIYRQYADFKNQDKPSYQFSPYLLEALLQAVNFYIFMKDEMEQRPMIPRSIGQVVPVRKCQEGEIITVEARIDDFDEDRISWNARAIDRNMRPIMYVEKLEMSWF
jgi:acyl transferase domain-containing protein/NAD(P)H-dependent flavin oxidoreductase YrpB (nitropropane dioxygenase family)/NADP-dependent 3-hydroxy acid dehydrogenase YdfG/acyl carrier protein